MAKLSRLVNEDYRACKANSKIPPELEMNGDEMSEIPFVHKDGTPVRVCDIRNGARVVFEYDGAAFRLIKGRKRRLKKGRCYPSRKETDD